jgi:phytoene synthase
MIHAQHWERQLLDLAHQAMDSGVSAHPPVEAQRLHDAYAACETITRENSKTFYIASGLMPKEKRRATRALYAFCRVSDDIVDRPAAPGAPAHEHLEAWRGHVFTSDHQANITPVQREINLAWVDTRRTFGIPSGYVEQLIDGLSFDLIRPRYQTFTELVRYCYGVACTVGLMSMHISGYTGSAAIPFAIRLGVALQLTNILRDVGEDWRAGRLYLPLDELEAFGLTEDDVAAGVVDDRWRSFMRYQIQRARRLYHEALPGVSLLHRDGRFAIAAAGELYRGILDQIEANDYDVFRRRASISALGKLRRLPGIWWRAMFDRYTA